MFQFNRPNVLGSKIKFYDGFKNFLKLLCLFQVIDKTY